MSNYRRAQVPGACYFFTVVSHGRVPILGTPQAVDRLRASFRQVMAQRPFAVDGMVILPDHLHCLWRLPPGDADYATRWRLIKHHFSVALSAGRNRRREKAVWQRRYWEHVIRDQDDWQRHMDYIHYNPVKHGFAPGPGEWPHSSFAQAVAKGWYDSNWGRTEPPTLHGLDLE